MRYLPIMDELFSSDSIAFLLIGLVIALVIGIKLKEVKKTTLGIVVSLIVYILSEVISNFCTAYLLEFVALFIGTVAIGCFLGFLVAVIISKLRKPTTKTI